MERLTEDFLGCNQIKGCDNFTCEEVCRRALNCGDCPIAEAFDKLAEYEQAEEDGLLIKLPCRVGDALYTFNVIKNEVTEHRAESKGFIVTILEYGALGRTIFLTKAEAEQALAKMKGE